jgi:conjugative relaxase-like TrwC/TraI family protein
MTIHRITAGDGYTYLTRQVAGGDVPRERGQDAAEYYTAQGNPPGYWTGLGAALLGLDGSAVTEAQMKALFGLGMHPDADAMIAVYIKQRVTAAMTPEQVEDLTRHAMRHATLGRAFPDYEPPDPFDERVVRRLAAIMNETGTAPTPAETARVRREEARAQRAAVAGWDVVFAPVKSAALLWALDERPQVRDAVRQAHLEAMGSALSMLEKHAAFTRAGAGGVAQIETRGLICAVFEHHDSRAGDPNLHTHVAVSTKVMGIDGKWRSLDARSLHAITVAASEHYNTMFETALSRLVGVTFTARPDTAAAREPVREITGVPAEYIAFFSSRRAAIETRYEQLVTAYRDQHGHDPSRVTCHKLARQANLDTRDQKKEPSSLTAKRAMWREQLTARFGPDAVVRLTIVVPGIHLQSGQATVPAAVPDPAVAARQVVDAVAVQRSVWTIWNLRAEAERAARQLEAPHGWAEEVAVLAASPGHSIPVTPPALTDEPAILRRSDGESVFTQHGAVRYTSEKIMDAENRLVHAARTLTAAAIAGPAVTASLDRFEAATATRLDPGQRHLVTVFAASGMLITAGIGPAGTGKTTAMRAYATVLHDAGHRLVPLAPSASAARVLGDSLGVSADTIDKFLYEHTRGPHAAVLAARGPVPSRLAVFTVRPGDVVLVDEASMAATLKLDEVTAIAARHGAVVRLLGDHAQLGAVEGGGALRLITAEAGAAELTAVYRFADPAEAAATLAVRAGDSAGLDYYFTNGRVMGGSRQEMAGAAYAGWKTDMLAGRTTLMAAAAGTDVTALAARARADRISAGQVEPGGVQLADGNLAGQGDWVLTRRNDRRLAVHQGSDWVKNGDGWHVTRRHDNGALTVTHLGHHGAITLPAAYVGQHVQLLYASTVHRAEGSTVDTAHPLITPSMTREALYTIISRARHATTLYVTTHETTPFDTDPQVDLVRHDPDMYQAREILEMITARGTAAQSATQAIRDEQQHAASLAAIIPSYLYALTGLTQARHEHAALAALGPDLAGRLTSDPAWPAVRRALLDAETVGWQPERVLAGAARRGPLDLADNAATLLAWRINDLTATRPAPAHLHQPTPADAVRYAALLTMITGTSIESAAMLQPPGCLTGPAVPQPHEQHPHIPADQLGRYADHAASMLGTTPDDITSHQSWPRLAAILTAASLESRDPAAFLAEASSAVPSGADQIGGLAIAADRLADGYGITSVKPAIWRHLSDVAAATGSDVADKARQETGWPALAAVLHRAAQDGHNLNDLLTRAAAEPGATGSASTSEFLARHITSYLTATPDHGPAAPAQLAWTLKAAEHYGTPAEAVVVNAGPSAGPEAILRHAQHAARPAVQQPVLPWLPADPAQPAPPGQNELAGYLTQTAEAISDRIRHLTDDTAATRPAWSLLLGPQPANGPHREQWTASLAVIAAYRDHYQATGDDPAQILGPYAGPGHAGHNAYWHAATAVHQACHQTQPGTPQPEGTDPAARAQAQITIDIFNALPEPERAQIAQQIATQAGPLWLGNPAGPDPEAVTQLAYAAQLTEALVARGHLAPPEPGHDAGATVVTPIEDIRIHNRYEHHASRGREPDALIVQTPPGPAPGYDVLPTL